jgi:flagellar basal body-associated protein FliL
MDNGIGAPQAIPPLPHTSPVKSNTGRNLVAATLVILIIFVLVGSGYMLFMGNAKKTTYTAQVYNQPTVAVSPTVTPTPTVYKVNVKDSSDNAINQDTQAANQDLNNLDTNLNNVDQSLNDQQTNLQ